MTAWRVCVCVLCVLCVCVCSLEALKLSSIKNSHSTRKWTRKADTTVVRFHLSLHYTQKNKHRAARLTLIHPEKWHWEETRSSSEEVEHYDGIQITAPSERSERAKEDHLQFWSGCRFNLRRLLHQHWKIFFPFPLSSLRFAVSCFLLYEKSEDGIKTFEQIKLFAVLRQSGGQISWYYTEKGYNNIYD